MPSKQDEIRILTGVKLNCLLPVEDDTVSKIILALSKVADDFPYSGLEFEYYPPLKEVDIA